MYREKSKTTATLAHCPARLVPAPRGKHRRSRRAARRHRCFHIRRVARQDDPNGQLAVVRSVSRIKRARAEIEKNVAAHRRFQPGFKFAVRRKALVLQRLKISEN